MYLAFNEAWGYEFNPQKITKWGHFKDFKWDETLRGDRDFFGPLNGHKRQQGVYFGPKKLRDTLKVEILCKGPF